MDKTDSMTDRDVTVLYEDDEVLVLDKPSGLVVHPDGKTKEPAVTDWLLTHYPNIRGVGEPLMLQGEILDRPGIVHRLDRETSGVMVVAKNQETFLYLKDEFQHRRVKKQYRAFLYGEMKEKEGVIDRPIARSARDFRLYSAQRGSRGTAREAVTFYKVLKIGQGCTYAEVEPKTGRTHQIRVHFKAINHPVVCDRLYAPNHPPMLGFSRLALHAYRISFSPKARAAVITVEAPLPNDFMAAERTLAAA